MKRKITRTIALVLSAVLLSLIYPDSAANAQQGRRRFSADTGIITLGPNQLLRVAISGDFDGNGDVGGSDFVFRRLGYLEQDNIYRVASQSASDPITLVQDEGASIDINQGGFNAVRCIVSGNLTASVAKNAKVTVHIIDRTTNQVDSVLIALLLP